MANENILPVDPHRIVGEPIASGGCGVTGTTISIKPPLYSATIEAIKNSTNDDEAAWRDKLFPCAGRPNNCNSHGLCEGCCERLIYEAGFSKGEKHGRALERAAWVQSQNRFAKESFGETAVRG